MFSIDAFHITLDKAARIFRKFGIRFHLTGGVATVFYGEPRLTQDIDIVIDNCQVSAVLESFLESVETSDFICDTNSVREAVANQGMFQLLDGMESLKLDIYPRELIPGELARSVSQEVFENVKLPMASRADVAASKLIWISKGSHKSRRDLRQIFRLSSQTDRQLIEELAEQLALMPLLREVLIEPEEIS